MDQYPAPHSLTAISTASVNTDRPERYAKQLVSHMQQKIPCEQVTDGHRLTFNRDGIFSGYGEVLVSPSEGGTRLVLRAIAADATCQKRIEDILTRHLEGFGRREQLSVKFQAE